jgi:hypothetical protein
MALPSSMGAADSRHGHLGVLFLRYGRPMDPLQCPDVPGNAVVRIVTAEHTSSCGVDD